MSLRTQITEQRLRDALQRILNGKPERTNADGKISLFRINMEAGCSRGLIYKYPDIIIDIKLAIEQQKVKRQRDSILKNQLSGADKEVKLKAKCDKQEKLKREYRNQRDNYQALADDAVKRENLLLFKCHELQIELNRFNYSRIVKLDNKN